MVVSLPVLFAICWVVFGVSSATENGSASVGLDETLDVGGDNTGAGVGLDVDVDGDVDEVDVNGDVDVDVDDEVSERGERGDVDVACSSGCFVFCFLGNTKCTAPMLIA
jgi:hypothetical protein